MTLLSKCVCAAALGLCVGLTPAAAEGGGKSAPSSLQKSAPAKAESGAAKLIAILKDAGLAVTDAGPKIDPAYKQAFMQVMRERGASDASMILVGQSTLVVAVEFTDEASLKAVRESRQPGIRYERLLILPGSERTETWNQLTQILSKRGAKVVSLSNAVSMAGQAASVLSQLQTIRAQIELFALAHKGAYPDFESSGWKELVDGKYVTKAPSNPMCPARVAARVAVVNTHGATGVEFAATSAGWVWNSVDHQMYPAGVTEEQLNATMNQAPDLDTAHWLLPPELVLKETLGDARAAIASFYVGSFKSHDVRFPTVAEIKEGKTPLKKIAANPFNGSAAVQLSTWKADSPPIGGAAGWNYDPKTGKLWANSHVVGENEW